MNKFILTLFVSFVSLTCSNLFAATEQTLSIIKPDAVADHHIGEIISRFEKSGLQVAALSMTRLSSEEAGDFYAVHKERPFYADLVKYMSSGPIVVMVLSGDNAVAKNREMMGATDPKKADKGTLRADFGKSIEQNAVHGSDSAETARDEIDFFFDPSDLVNAK